MARDIIPPRRSVLNVTVTFPSSATRKATFPTNAQSVTTSTRQVLWTQWVPFASCCLESDYSVQVHGHSMRLMSLSRFFRSRGCTQHVGALDGCTHQVTTSVEHEEAGNMRIELIADASLEKRTNCDWVGNNAAFTCPLCQRVFVVSAMINRDGRLCPDCGKSIGHVNGGRNTGGAAFLEWVNENAAQQTAAADS